MKYFIFLICALAVLYGSAWFSSRRTYPVVYGISFNQNQAAALGLDWRKTYSAMLKELHPTSIRIAAMWSEVEKEPGKFNFADVDWMMNEAKKNGASAIMVVGQKAPRWPECYVPEWMKQIPDTDGEKRLSAYIKKVVERYRTHPALELWQVENEPFILFSFGECTLYRQELVPQEIALVKALDPDHKIMITDSGELGLWRQAIKAGDFFGATLYRVVRTPRGTLIKYDWLPPALYRWKARFMGAPLNTMFISELQAEPWFTGVGAAETPIEVQEETMNPARLKKHIDYAAHIGVPRAYLWGVEWWYWMKEKKNDDRYWEIVKETIGNNRVDP